MAKANDTKKPAKKRRVRRYFGEVKGEFKKVVWPTKKQAWNNSLVVVGIALAVGVCIWAFDSVLALVLGLLL